MRISLDQVKLCLFLERELLFSFQVFNFLERLQEHRRGPVNPGVRINLLGVVELEAAARANSDLEHLALRVR